MHLILVIDDEALIRANLVLLLEAEGFRVVQAESGFRGLELAREHQPDLIICDVTMPRLDGYGVLAQLRQDPLTATTPFIFLTGHTNQADVRQGMNLGADDYLSKPFTRPELLQAISTRLAKQAAFARLYAAQLEQIQQKLDTLAHYDSLTGLSNRNSLEQRFERYLKPVAQPVRIALLSLVIDRFNRINDRLGYSFGDILLKEVSERLLAGAPVNATIARLQGSQFVLLVPAAEEAQATDLARSLLEQFAQPFTLDGQEVFITISVGMALLTTPSDTLDRLLQNAATALAQVRQEGGNGYLLYTPTMNGHSGPSLELETALRYALQRDELRVYYQPQVDLRLNRVVGAEALVRWQHPERGLVSPSEFIPLAEETNLIVPLSEWVLRTACETAKTWQVMGRALIRIAVNLSVRQLSQPDLVEKVAQILVETGLSADCLELEITESMVMQDAERAIQTLNALKGLGLRIALDDFGTGYSSLSQLRRFNFDTLKIDQSFIRDVTGSTDNSAITLAIIEMGHHLNCKVVAEGVETEAELAFLLEHNCDEMQGYLFSRPLPRAEFEQWLDAATGFNHYLERRFS